MSDRNRQVLNDLLQRPGNTVCADCACQNDDGWASCNLGVFLCQNCAGIHRNLGVNISRVKSIKLDNWDDEQVQKMAECGNYAVNEKYEKFLPLYYKRPTKDDANVLHNQFIRAKYERKEFMNKDKQAAYDCQLKEGKLMKQLKNDRRYMPRKFILSNQDNSLSYHKETASKYKETIPLEDLNAVFVPEKTGNPNCLQITFLKTGSTRSLFVYSDDAREIVDWYTALRHAKFKRRQVAFPTQNEVELAKDLTQDFLCEGYLNKMGPHNRPWKRRWFTLDRRKLMYFEEPLYAYAKGEIFIGYRDASYMVGEATNLRSPKGCPFNLITPERTFVLSADSFEDRDRWIMALTNVIDTQPTPQDFRLNNTLVSKKK